VRTLLDKALRAEPLEVWGDGSAVRDYLFIDDAVEAFERLIAQPDLSGTFNSKSLQAWRTWGTHRSCLGGPC
jgi:UDP-glucose 4-epimerase